MKSLFGAISPNRESSEHADEQIREKRERVITPASGNVFDYQLYKVGTLLCFVQHEFLHGEVVAMHI